MRLSPITTEGAQESIALFAAGKTDLAVARGDLNLPAECRVGCHPAQECRRAVVGARASDKGQETVGAEGQDTGCAGRASRRRDRTDRGQRQAAARHPEGVRHRSGKGRGQPVRHQPDCRDGARSVARRVHGGRPAQEQDHGGRHRRNRHSPRRTQIPADRRRRCDREEEPDLRIRGNPRQHFQLFPGASRRQGRYRQHQSSDHRAEVAVGHGGRPPSPGSSLPIASNWRGNSQPPRRSRNPTPTRMPRCRPMQALPPISTATNGRFSKSTPTTSGA